MLKNQFKNYLLLPYDIIMIILYIIAFKIFQINFKKSVNSLIRLFCVTGGLSNDIISFFTKKKSKKLQSEIKDPKYDFDLIDKSLKDNGYFIVDNFLSDEDCNNLFKFLLETELIAKTNGKIIDNKTFFDSKNPKAVFYEMSKEKIFNSEISQKLVFNKFIYKISENYFGSMPLFDHMSLAISAKSQLPDSYAAQLFHFDLERPKWLKFFIYLNDVDDNNGPHFFVPKSHKNLGIVKEIRSKGYSRIEDQIVEKYYPEIKKITGKKGTLLIEDTRGLHKGSVVRKDFRCLALLQFNNSNFGSENHEYKFKINDKDNLSFFLDYSETYSNIKNLI